MNKAGKLRCLAAAIGLVVGCSAHAAWPSAPIQLIVPYAAGGNLDVTARTIAPHLGRELNGSVVVLNKPGAGGSVGATYTSRAAADGYTVLITATTELSVTPHITNAPYAMDDFALVGTINTVPMMIEVRSDSKYESFRQLMDDACASADTVTMGIAGIGSVNFMALRQLQEVTGCTFAMVPYNGSGPALVGLMSGQIDAIIDQVSSSKPYLEDKRIRPLVVMSEDKVEGFDDVPSLQQSGIQGADMATVAALVVPAETPTEIRETISAALKKVTRDETVQDVIIGLGGLPFVGSEDNFMEAIKPLDQLARKYKAEGTLSVQ